MMQIAVADRLKCSGMEFDLESMLNDPMVGDVMAADRVDRDELAAMLAAVAQTLQPPRQRLSHRVADLFCSHRAA